jgi:serine/threonine protein kinase
MTNWLGRWFDKPKAVAKTVLRVPVAAAEPSVAPTAAKPADDPTPVDTWQPGASILGEYRVERELGHGSMGTVYLVSRAQAAGQRFAVKRVRVTGDVYRRHFLAELQTWLDLAEHPNLVACRFFRTVGDELVIFAEYIEGAALSDWIEQNKLDRVETVLDFAIQFAWGLHAAHEQGVVHQDVKPGNALVAADGTVKVADFGLARAQSAAMRASTAEGHGTMVVAHAGGWTEAYCSPEQAQDLPLSRQSDLWSWGLSVLEMFAGRVAWHSGVLVQCCVLFGT